MLCEKCGRQEGTAYTFWCVKTTDLGEAGKPTPFSAPAYAFSASVCDACIGQKQHRLKRTYGVLTFVVHPLVFLAATFALASLLPQLESFGGVGPHTFRRDWTSAIALAAIGVTLSLVVFLLGIVRPSLLRENLGKQVAAELRRAVLKTAGYQGFWWTPPKKLQVR
jgi:hypothetical protein